MELTRKQKSVYSYLKRNNIRGGVYRTPLFVLYYFYVKFCNHQKRERVSPIEFGRRMALYFEKGKSGRYAYYLTSLQPPAAKKRAHMCRWYDRQWTRMRNGKKEKGKVS